jgi:uncharacterized protein (DUF2336 family)
MSKSPANPPLDGLLDLACRDGVDIRPTLLRVLTDLYVQKRAHSEEEEAQYVELAHRLIEAVDAPTRAVVALRLSRYTGAPAAILNRLAQFSEQPDADAPAAAAAKTPAEPDLVETFFAANASERRLILTNLDMVAQDAPRRPLPASSEVVRRLENAALSRNPGEFGRILERALSIRRGLAERVTRDHSGEPIVVAAKALGMKVDVLQRIVLFLNPTVGQSIERVYDLVQLYEDITPAAADRMIAIWRTSGSARQPVYESATFDDEKRSAWPVSTPAQRRQTPELPTSITINRR